MIILEIKSGVKFPKDADRIENSADLKQALPLGESDLGLHCMMQPKHVQKQRNV